jgi:hypothetical protein
MIDFDKPMRVVGSHELLKKCDYPCAVMHDGAVSFLVHGHTGIIYKFTRTPDIAENIPEPRRRYQAQYKKHMSGYWKEEKITSRTDIIAWIIETDHGEGASPRYTYEREDV